MTPRPDFQVHEIYEPVHYTARELLACRRELRGILIAPFNKTKCKGLGYRNIFSRFTEPNKRHTF